MRLLSPNREQKKLFLLSISALLILSHVTAQRPKLEIKMHSPVTVIETGKLADVRTVNIGNLTETLYRDVASKAIVKRESQYDYTSIGGGFRNDLVLYLDQQPAYIRSTVSDLNKLPIEVVERIGVLKDAKEYHWESNKGKPVAYTINPNAKERLTMEATMQYKPFYTPPTITTPATPVKGIDRVEEILQKLRMGSSTTTRKDDTYGNGGSASYTYRPFAGFDDVETETIEYKDAKGTVRKKIYNEYYRDGWEYSEVTYFDCDGKPIHFDSSVYDERGYEWEYLEMEYLNGQPIAGYRDIADEDEEGYYEFREYYNPISQRFEDDPEGSDPWDDYDDYSYNIDRVDDPCCNFKKNALFIAISLIREDYSMDDKMNMFGGVLDYTRNFNCHFGATLDVGINFGKMDMTKYNKINLLAGVTYAPFEKWGLDKKFSATVHALAGVQFLKSKYDYMGNSSTSNSNAFTVAVGPRVDYKIADKFWIGASIEYMPVFGANHTANNYRFSAGIRTNF